MMLSMTTLEISPVTAAQVATWTRRDPVLSAVVKFVQQGWPDSPCKEYAMYFRRKDELSVQAWCLMWASRVIIPTPRREATFAELQECHPGIVPTKAFTRSVVWWPGIDNEILDQSSCVRGVPATEECASCNPAAPMGVARTAVA